MANDLEDIGKICVPGMRLGAANDEFIAGPGTNEIRGYIYANIAGILRNVVDEQSKTTTVSVESPKTASILPKTGDIVTAKVTVVNPRMVYCNLICVNENVLTRSYRGIIKREDIRPVDKEQVDPYKCFRPGDIILGRVLPASEIHHYPLTTIENELGVVIARADGAPLGVNMVPISWSEMQCPKTLVKEKRKVARVLPERFIYDTQDVEMNGEATQSEISNKT